jgi:hypothetical protein
VTGGQPSTPQQSAVWRAVTAVLLVALLTAIYYALPVPARLHEGSWAVLFFGGVVVLGVLIILAVRRLLRAGEQARIRGLVVLLTITVMFFSWADESVAKLPGQFAQLTNKTDALYFNISTLATVGYGDVHPTGQLARAAVTLQIVFNLIFLGTAVSVISGYFRAHANKLQSGRSSAGGSGAGGSGAGGSGAGGSGAGGSGAGGSGAGGSGAGGSGAGGSGAGGSGAGRSGAGGSKDAPKT